MSRSLRLFLILLAAVAVLIAGLWLLRRPLSEAVVARWFAAQGIPAKYRITALSGDRATLADLVLGPPERPDFRADRVDIRLGWSLVSPSIGTVVLVRPRVRATLGPKGVSLGSLDKLFPGGPAKPLPDIDLRLQDGQLDLVTAYGTLTGRGSGGGRLRGGFKGRFVIADADLSGGGCQARLTGTALAVATRRSGAQVSGGGQFPAVICADGRAQAVGWKVSADLPPTYDRYDARLSMTAASVVTNGFAVARVNATLGATAASLGGPVSGPFSLTTGIAKATQGRAAGLAADGSFSFDPGSGDARADARATASGASVALPRQALDKAARRADGTLARPLLTALAARLDAAARDFSASARVEATRRAGRTTLTIADARLAARSGATAVKSGSFTLLDGFQARGSLSIRGGGLPTATLTGDGGWRAGRATGQGTLSLARWTVPGASIEAPALALSAANGAVRVDGLVRLAGSVGAGVVAEGLAVPLALTVDPAGGVGFGDRCLPVAWTRLRRDDLLLDGGSVRLCPTGRWLAKWRGGQLNGGLAADPVRLRGSSGGQAFTLTTASLRATLAKTSATIAPLAIDGTFGARRMRATLSGSYDLAAAAGRGRVATASLDDPASPVSITDVGADWRLAGSTARLTGASARVSDRTAPARFQPLRVHDTSAVIAGGIISGNGALRLEAGGAPLLRFTLRHDIARASGTAHLDTGTLNFGPALQPYQITESLRGVVANVVGPVTGTGEVAWTGTTLSSRGTLRIDALSLATEALGPVAGVSGTLVFDDLLAMTTPPGQRLTVASINPGIEVNDGVVQFRMLGPDAAAIDSITWPYAGGTLALAPVTIRAGDARRDFLLTVEGLDAEQFLQRFEIKNLNVTGRFDGRLPLVFADGRGRIVDGHLEARAGGGLVQYVGEIGRENVGAAAKLAFEALRRLRYRNLALDFDGDLDGELVSRVRFAGSNEAAATLPGGPLPLKVTGLPFRFGITVRAPFRALLGTAASFNDVRPLIRAAPEQVQPR